MKILNHKFTFHHLKVKSAYGICSKVNTVVRGNKTPRGGVHYLLMDFDSPIDELKNYQKTVSSIVYRFKNSPISAYPTEHGFHVIIWKRFYLWQAAVELLKTPNIDVGWVGIGLKRGYWFLEQKKPVAHPVVAERASVRYMKIERAV